MTSKPLYVSKIQMRLAVELAAQIACQSEYKRQIEPQLIGVELHVTGAEMDIQIGTWPEFNVHGRQVIWTD